MELHAEQADRVVALGQIHRAELDAGGIDHRDRARAHHLDRVVGRNERGGVLVESEPDSEGIVGQRGEQPSQPVALAEVLVDDHPVGEAEAGGDRHAAGAGRGALFPVGDHVLGEKGGAGGGPRDRDSGRAHQPDPLGHGGAAEVGREPELIAAGQEDSGRLSQALQQVLAFAIPPLLERERLGGLDAHLAEYPLVARAGIGGERGGGDDRDAGALAAAQLDEAPEDRRVVGLGFRAADGNDVPARLPGRDLCRAHDCTPSKVP